MLAVFYFHEARVARGVTFLAYVVGDVVSIIVGKVAHGAFGAVGFLHNRGVQTELYMQPILELPWLWNAFFGSGNICINCMFLAQDSTAKWT